jgi:hypothetical protein
MQNVDEEGKHSKDVMEAYYHIILCSHSERLDLPN